MTEKDQVDLPKKELSIEQGQANDVGGRSQCQHQTCDKICIQLS